MPLIQFVSMCDETKVLDSANNSVSVQTKLVISSPQVVSQQYRMIPCHYPYANSSLAYFLEKADDARFVLQPIKPNDAKLKFDVRYLKNNSKFVSS